MLAKQMKYLRATSNQDINGMTKEQLQGELERVNELNGIDTNDIFKMKEKLKEVERTRHLMVWLDNSTVANSGYLVCLITCLYDPAVFYTDEEYKQAFGRNVNIQQIIEEPELHFIARCGSSESEQILYSDERLKCIAGLGNKCTERVKNIEFTDKLRLCHGDMPLRAFEAGQQKGGNYFCSACGIHCDMVYCLDHALNCHFTSLKERQDVILQGVVARRKSMQKKLKPLEGLSKTELAEELGSRQIYDGKTKEDLRQLLTETLQGKQRVPALLFNTPNDSLSNLGLDSYEILPCEPLHDLGHHIENFFAEFSKHLSREESKILEEAISLSLTGKDSKRCVDFRVALIKTAGFAHQSGIFSQEALQTIDTLTEMQRILYSGDKNRSPAQVLRYYNQAWYHSILLHDYIVNNPKKLTLRKMFGVYFHNLSAHAGDMLRIISGQSTNAERQERIFNSIKRITKQTSNYHPGHIIPNLFIRLQAERELGLQANDPGRQQAQVSNLSKCLPQRKNTVIPLSIIKKHSREWQSHLQHISDFLLEGESVWWKKTDNGIEFHDVSDYPDPLLRGPQLHHFRSQTLSNEEHYLKSCWEVCVRENIAIPLHIIRVDQKDGTTKRVHTSYLGDAVPNDPMPVPEPNEPVPEPNDFMPVPQLNEPVPEPNDPVPVPEPNEPVPEPNSLMPVPEPNESVPEPNDPMEEVIEVYPAPDEVINLKDRDPFQEEQTIEHTHLQDQGYEYVVKSSLCRAIQVLFGPSKELETLDKKHLHLKMLQIHMAELYPKYLFVDPTRTESE